MNWIKIMMPAAPANWSDTIKNQMNSPAYTKPFTRITPIKDSLRFTPSDSALTIICNNDINPPTEPAMMRAHQNMVMYDGGTSHMNKKPSPMKIPIAISAGTTLNKRKISVDVGLEYLRAIFPFFHPRW